MFSIQKNIYFYAAGITILMGHNMLLIKSLLSTVEPLVLTFLRMIFTAATLAIICYLKFGLIKPSRAQWKDLFIISIFGVFLHQITLALGLELTQATNGALIMGLNPLLTTLLGALLLKEKLFRRHYIGIIVSFIGVCFIVFQGFSSFSFSLGDILLFISMATQALSFVYTRKLAGSMEIIPITAYMYTLGSLMLVVIPISQDMSSVFTFSGFIWFKIMIASVVLTAFGFLGFNICIQYLGAGGASIFLNIVTVTSMLGAVVYLGEKLLSQHIFGFLFISVGIWIAAYQKKPSLTVEPAQQSTGS
ncbi:DMT family transporter [bacterium LRH843]|nr:DMT family transporter [bacterium LRH843]